MKRREFLSALGLAALAATLPIEVLEAHVDFTKVSDIRLVAEFALRELKGLLHGRKYESFSVSAPLGPQILGVDAKWPMKLNEKFDHTAPTGPQILGVDAKWPMKLNDSSEWMNRHITPAIAALAQRVKDLGITGFSELSLPPAQLDAARATDESNISIRVIKDFDEMILNFSILVK